MTASGDTEWLALREPFDAAARSLSLAGQFVAALPARPRLLNLGAGIGGSFRFLAPMIGRAQVWTFVETDDGLLGEAFDRTATWAERQGWTVTWPGRALLVHAPGGAWRIEGRVEDLDDPFAALATVRHDAVVCDALSDGASGAWIAELANAIRHPCLTTLVRDGRDAWLPLHPADALVRAGVRRALARGQNFGPMLGVSTPSHLMRRFATRGHSMRSAPSDWRVPGSAISMAVALTAAAAAASLALPARRTAIDEWEHARLTQARRGGLAIRLGHRDILALPR